MSVLEKYNLDLHGEYDSQFLLQLFEKDRSVFNYAVGSVYTSCTLETHLLRKLSEEGKYDELRGIVGNCMNLVELEVDDDYQNCGIGRALLTHTIEEVSKTKIESIVCQVYPIHTDDLELEERLQVQQRLVAFYKSFGFEMFYQTNSDEGIPVIVMYLKFNGNTVNERNNYSHIFTKEENSNATI